VFACGRGVAILLRLACGCRAARGGRPLGAGSACCPVFERLLGLESVAPRGCRPLQGPGWQRLLQNVSRGLSPSRVSTPQDSPLVATVTSPHPWRRRARQMPSRRSMTRGGRQRARPRPQSVNRSARRPHRCRRHRGGPGSPCTRTETRRSRARAGAARAGTPAAASRPFASALLPTGCG
jgi:hypothetical protein